MAEGARITIDAQLQFRHDVEANWLAADPILKVGEPAYTIGYSDRFKLGDGQSKWSELPYLQLGEGGGGGGSQAYESLAWSAIKTLTSGDASVLAQAYAVKQAYTELKSLIPNLADYYTKEQINALIPSLEGYATEAWVLGKGYATESFVNTKIADLINGAPTTLDTLKEIADAFAQSQDVIEALDEAIGKKANQSDLTALSGRVDTLSGNLQGYAGDLQNVREDVDGIMGDYITQSELDSAIAGITGGGGSLGNRVGSLEAAVGVLEGYVPDDIAEGDVFASQQWVLSKNYALKSDIPTIPSLSGYATQQWVLDRGYLTSASLDALQQAIDNNATDIGDHENRIATIEDNYAKKSAIPTSLSDLANDVGYITSAAIPTSYAWSAITGKPSFATVATSGSYNDLSNKPTIPSIAGLASESWVSNNYLPLSGGTMTGDILINGAIRDTNGNWIVGKADNDTGVVSLGSTNLAQVVKLNNSAGSIQLNYEGNVIVSGTISASGGMLYNGVDNSPLVVKGVAEDAYIGFQHGNNTSLGSIGINAYLGPVYWDSANRVNRIFIHSGNIGSQSVNYATSAGSVDMSTVTSFDDYRINSLYGWYDWGVGVNTYSDFSFGISVNSPDPNHRANIGFDAFSGDVYIKIKQGANNWRPWQAIAFMDSNVASATKLQTARTIWGHSFDGTGNVSGTLYHVAGIKGVENGINIGLHPSRNDLEFGLTLNNRNDDYLGEFAYYRDHFIIGNFKNGIENCYIDLYDNGNIGLSGGNVLIGTTEDSGNKLEVVGDARFQSGNANVLNIKRLAAGGALIGYYAMNQNTNAWKVGAAHDYSFIWEYNGTDKMTLSNAGNLTASGEITALGSSSSSDIRLKNIVGRPTPLTLEDIAKLNVISFKWNHRENDKRLKIGLVAQEVQEVLPELVGVDRSNFLTLDYSTFGSVVGVMNTKRILSLEERVEALENENKELRRKIYG